MSDAAQATGGGPATTTAPGASSGNMGRDGVLNIVGMAVSTAATFGVAMVLARGEGLAAVGDYSTIFAARAILLLLCGLGMRIALTKYVAAAGARRDYAQLRSILRYGVGVPALLAVVLGIVVVAVRDPVDARFFASEAEGHTWLLLLAISMPSGVVLDLVLAASRGLQDAASAVRIGQIFEPVTRLAITAAVVLLGAGTTGALVALTVASVASALLACVSLRRQVRHLSTDHEPVVFLDMFGFAVVSWLASLATQGLLWADIVILSALASSEEVGVYQVATRLVILAMLCITPLTQSLAPRIAHFWEVQDLDTLRERYQVIVLWSWRLTIGLFASLLIVPGDALRLFGTELSDGVAVVYILAAGSLFESFAAPSAVLLNQIGRNGLNMVINTANLALNITLNFLLIPSFGIRGAALAWSISLALPGVLRVYLVRRVAFEHQPVNRLHLRAAAVVLVVAAVGWLLVVALPSLWWLRLAVGVPFVLAAYAVGVLRYASTPQERKRASRMRRIVSRELLTRVSWLKRWADRRRAGTLVTADQPLPILELVSPFRYDVWARHALFEYADAHRDLRREDFPAFVRGARQTQYGRWFDVIMIRHLGLEGSSRRLQERTFEQSIIRGLALLDSYDRTGFDARFPVSVTRLPACVELEDRSLAEERWLTVDGNHRLALLLRAGRTILEPHEYRIDTTTAPRNNTPAMSEASLLSEADLCSFYAQGLVGPELRDRVSSWDDLLQSLANPANREHLERWPEHARYSRSLLPGQVSSTVSDQ